MVPTRRCCRNESGRQAIRRNQQTTTRFVLAGRCCAPVLYGYLYNQIQHRLRKKKKKTGRVICCTGRASAGSIHPSRTNPNKSFSFFFFVAWCCRRNGRSFLSRSLHLLGMSAEHNNDDSFVSYLRSSVYYPAARTKRAATAISDEQETRGCWALQMKNRKDFPQKPPECGESSRQRHGQKRKRGRGDDGVAHVLLCGVDEEEERRSEISATHKPSGEEKREAKGQLTGNPWKNKKKKEEEEAVNASPAAGLGHIDLDRYKSVNR